MKTDQYIVQQLSLQDNLQAFCDQMFKWKWLDDKHNELLSSDYLPEEISDMMNIYEDECKFGYLETWKYKYQDVYDTFQQVVQNHQMIQDVFIDYLVSDCDQCQLSMVQKFDQLIGIEDAESIVMDLTVKGEFEAAKKIEEVCLNK